jgi:hypothetical protein
MTTVGRSNCGSAPLWFGSVRFGSLGSTRFDSVRFDSVRFDSVRFDSVRFGSVRFEQATKHTSAEAMLRAKRTARALRLADDGVFSEREPHRQLSPVGHRGGTLDVRHVNVAKTACGIEG